LREPANHYEQNYARDQELHKFDQKRGSNSQNLFDDNDSSDEKEECDKRFQILEKLGEGAYGHVYKAKDLHLNRVSFSRFFIRAGGNIGKNFGKKTFINFLIDEIKIT